MADYIFKIHVFIFGSLNQSVKIVDVSFFVFAVMVFYGFFAYHRLQCVFSLRKIRLFVFHIFSLLVHFTNKPLRDAISSDP